VYVLRQVARREHQVKYINLCSIFISATMYFASEKWWWLMLFIIQLSLFLSIEKEEDGKGGRRSSS
jgi:hypothetical protein